jgi:hypothetical protein
MITILVIHFTAWILAAIADAVMDKISFHYDKSIFIKSPDTIDHKYFWDPSISWRNKYKGRIKRNGAKFLGSTTIFVMFTDAFHLFQAVMNFFIIVTVITGLYLTPYMSWSWWEIGLIFIGYKVVYSSTFELFFGKLLNR